LLFNIVLPVHYHHNADWIYFISNNTLVD